MDKFSIILLLILSILLLLNYLSLSRKSNISHIIKNMGIGYNLANTFDNYIEGEEINDPIEQITLKGNQVPTQKLVKNLKKYGFNTIRLPVTWVHFIDDFGNVKKIWMSQVKNAVDIIIKNKVYCILNIYGDKDFGNWLNEGIASKDIYINFWRQIAEEFKDYTEYLIFESMDDTIFFKRYDYDYEAYSILNQLFIDIIRNSSNYNKDRLLIISSINSEIEFTCSDNFVIPNDPYNKLALSIHYYTDYEFVIGDHDSEEYIRWGYQENFNDLINNLEILKKNFVNRGIPVIISEFGVKTELKKEIDSIRLYIYSMISFSLNYGMVPCLWDTSNKQYGDMNFYDRENDQWYDKKISEIISLVSKRKNDNLLDYLINTNTIFNLNEKEKKQISIYTYRIRPIRIIVNALIKGRLYEVVNNLEITFSVEIVNFGSGRDILNYDINNIKKQYDGTIIVDAEIFDNYSFKHVFTSVLISVYSGTINNITLFLEESLNFFNYISFKSDFNKLFN